MHVYKISPVTVDISTKKRGFLKSEEDSVPLPDPFPLPKHYACDIEVSLNVKPRETEIYIGSGLCNVILQKISNQCRL